MATQFQLDIKTEASSSVVLAGSDNLLSNGGFESFTGPNPSDWAWDGSLTLAQETTEVYEGSSSLSFTRVSGTPSLFQIIDATSLDLVGKTLKVTGRIKSSTSATQKLSMAFGINSVSSPTIINPTGTQNDNVVIPESGLYFTMEYDNSQWHEFSYYYVVPPEMTLLINSIGPVFLPTENTSTTEVFIDDVVMFTELENRSEKWRIDIEPVNRYIYGYGYGAGFRNAADVDTDDTINYFNVIGVLGEELGFGIEETKSTEGLPQDLVDDGYSYAFGFESAPAFLSNKVDSLVVKATVYENNFRQPNVKIIFKGSPHICIEPNSTITDDRGEAFATISIDDETLQDTTRSPNDSILSLIPRDGFLTIFAEIDKHPRENEGISLIKTEAIQLTETEAVDFLNIGTYAFQNRNETAYGFSGYGYDPF